MNSRPFSIHPHKGYLNTEITITNTSNADIVIYDNGNKVGSLPPNCLMTGCFSAGAHVITTQEDYLSCLDNDEFLIEDAIKLGGGKIVKGYIFDKSPWIVVKMTDRMYFHNMDTNVEFVEMNLTPDEITVINSDLLLFETKNEGYSIYSVSASNVIARFIDKPLYIGEYLFLYRSSEDKLSILFYEDCQVKTKQYERYAINEVLKEIYIYENNSLRVISLQTGEELDVLFLDNPLISLTSEGNYVLLIKSYAGDTIKIYSVHDSDHTEFRDCIKLKSNVTCVCSYKLVEDSFLESLDDEYERLWSQRDSHFKNFISLDSRYSEIINLYILESTVYYVEKRISRNLYGRKKENYYLCSSQFSEPIEIYPYTTIYRHNSSIVFQLDSNVVTITNGAIHYTIGSLIQHNNVKYILSKTKESQAIITLEGEIIYEGSFDTSTSAFSLNKKKTIPIKLFESYGLVINTQDGIKRLQRAIYYSHAMYYNPIIFDSLYILDDQLIVENNNKLIYISYKYGDCLLSSTPSEINTILSISEYGKYVLKNRSEEILYEGSEILLYESEEEKFNYEIRIFEDIFDVSAYSEALFSKDGDNIVYADAKGKYFQRNLTTGEITEFDSCKFIKHINGYSPSIEIVDNRIPRIINPVTGCYVETNLFEFKFASPDGEWTVVEPDELALDNVGGLECFHKATRKKLTIKEYNELRQKLDVSRFTSSASIGVRQERRKEMANHPQLFVDELNRRCSESVAWKRAKINANVILMYAINSLGVDDIAREALDCFVEYTRVFSNFLVDVTEFIEISNQTSGQTRRINIGIPLWFMNYISFSYDSRYVAMAGRYEDDTIDENRTSLGGLYLLYDLIEDKVVSKKTNSQAVWVTSFTKDGYIGFYDSHPTTYITNSANDEIIIGGRNFLTFSASGKYFALSNQGYVRYENATTDRPGGHQPSTNVYIREISSPMEELAQYNDHGDKIKGVMTKKARTVAMVAFSYDDKRLLSISDDGVIVIRNLHL